MFACSSVIYFIPFAVYNFKELTHKFSGCAAPLTNNGRENRLKGDILQHNDVLSSSLPQIDLARIPELDLATALFGAQDDLSGPQLIDDDRAHLLACLYELQTRG